MYSGCQTTPHVGRTPLHSHTSSRFDIRQAFATFGTHVRPAGALIHNQEVTWAALFCYDDISYRFVLSAQTVSKVDRAQISLVVRPQPDSFRTLVSTWNANLGSLFYTERKFETDHCVMKNQLRSLSMMFTNENQTFCLFFFKLLFQCC